jgi:hypothetical protein
MSHAKIPIARRDCEQSRFFASLRMTRNGIKSDFFNNLLELSSKRIAARLIESANEPSAL